MSVLFSNIRRQPDSLRSTLLYHSGGGSVAMKEAAALLRSASKIVITGMGASLFASIPLQYHLSSQGMNVVAIEAAELLHYLDHVWNDAVVIMVSRSGESIEIAKLLEKMRGRVRVIGVSNEPDSLLDRTADISLSIASLHDQIVAIQTYTGTLLTLHLLASYLTNSFDSAVEEVHQLLPAFASLAETSMSSLSHWDAFLGPPASLYLLARGPSLASAYEGALLFHEVSKSPAVAMPAASFRHGPVEVVDQYFRAAIFAPQDRTRELNIALAHDIVHFGGQVRVIGQPTPPHELEWCSVPSASLTLAPIFEIVPLQAAAYQLAVLRGIEPGSFRFAPQVATDEASFSQRPATPKK